MSPGSTMRPRLYSSCDSKAAASASTSSAGGSFSFFEDADFDPPPGFFFEADAKGGNASRQRQTIRRAFTFLYSLRGFSVSRDGPRAGGLGSPRSPEQIGRASCRER